MLLGKKLGKYGIYPPRSAEAPSRDPSSNQSHSPLLFGRVAKAPLKQLSEKTSTVRERGLTTPLVP